MSSPQVSIGFIVAMKEEADILAKNLGLILQPSQAAAYNTYTDAKRTLVMLTPGNDEKFNFNGQPLSRVGKVSAGIITTILINEYHPRMIINCGTAGGIGRSTTVGDIVVADAVTNHDMRFPFPGYAEWAKRKTLLKNVHKIASIKLPYKVGTVSSAESFTPLSEEWEVISKNGAIAKDMEAAGVLQALEILNDATPCYVIKVITDAVTSDADEATSSDDFLGNFTLAMNNLSDFVRKMVEVKESLHT